MKQDIFCPDCSRGGMRKKIAATDSQTSGIIYLWCKCCKAEKRIVLPLNKTQ